jgi:hypothetical protein
MKVRQLVKEAQARVVAELPEDEHDYTAPWVYETAIRVGMEAVEEAKLSEEVQAFKERLRRRGAARQAARLSLMQRVREFVNEFGRNGSKTGRPDYACTVTLDKFEPLRVALDEYDRVLTAPAASRTQEETHG